MIRGKSFQYEIFKWTGMLNLRVPKKCFFWRKIYIWEYKTSFKCFVIPPNSKVKKKRKKKKTAKQSFALRRLPQKFATRFKKQDLITCEWKGHVVVSILREFIVHFAMNGRAVAGKTPTNPSYITMGLTWPCHNLFLCIKARIIFRCAIYIIQWFSVCKLCCDD